MRTYFEKPRTTVGWKGLINDPHLDGSCDVAAGLELARGLLLELAELGVACASEVLDPFTPQFVADLLAWGSIGARTAESQTHRQLASGLSMPVGFKNGTDGGLEAAKNAMIAASHAHSFLGITPDGRSAVVTTTGNPDRHLILRGGGGRTNYAAEDVARAAALVAEQGIARAIMVDCSHDNSGKDPARQGAVCRAVLVPARRGPASSAARPADRELPRARSPDLAQGRAARARRLHHRWLHRLGGDRGAARRDRRGRAGRAVASGARSEAEPSGAARGAARRRRGPANRGARSEAEPSGVLRTRGARSEDPEPQRSAQRGGAERSPASPRSSRATPPHEPATSRPNRFRARSTRFDAGPMKTADPCVAHASHESCFRASLRRGSRRVARRRRRRRSSAAASRPRPR